MEKQTKKHYPLENKHSTIGNICCQGCYRMGLEQGKALALADVMKIIDEEFESAKIQKTHTCILEHEDDHICLTCFEMQVYKELKAKLQEKTNG